MTRRILDIETVDAKPLAARDPAQSKRRDWARVWNALRGRYGSRHMEAVVGRSPKVRSDREYHDAVRAENRRIRRAIRVWLRAWGWAEGIEPEDEP